jgi:diguanylate cyclase (GGDEF)-like protein
VAQRIRAALESERFRPRDGLEVQITISVGVTEYAHREELSTFIQRADKAMYISKQNGRNKVSMLYAKEGRASEMTNDE